MIVLYWLVAVHHVYHKILVLDLTAVGAVLSAETGVIVVVVLSLVQETVLNQTLLALILRPVLLLEEQTSLLMELILVLKCLT